MHLTTSTDTTAALLSSSLLLLLLLVVAHPAHAAQQPKPKPKDAILLSEVQSLTLRGAGALTAHRRSPAVPQLQCVSSPGVCALHDIDVMRCANQGAGYDSEDVQWSCVASLPPELKLGSTDVACEGYSSPDDPYVLRGSCGVEYRLVLTEAGEQRFPDLANGGGGSGGWPWGGGDKKKGSSSGNNHKGQGSDPSAVIFGIIFAAVCIWIIYNACIAGNVNNTIRLGGPRRRRNNWGGGGGGGGFDPGFGPGGGGGGNGGSGDTWDDPPPPYSASKTSSSTRNATQSEGWRPGFWSGLAGGAAAGYMAGNRGNNRQEPRRYDSGWGAGPSSSGSSSSGSRSTSSARYESTGFGSTSRR